MRKLSELLALARQHLRTADNPGEIYVCYAADHVRDYSNVSVSARFSDAIHLEMRRQSPGGRNPTFLYELLRELGTIPATTHAGHPDYIPHRDKWLDEWQAKLEGEGQ